MIFYVCTAFDNNRVAHAAGTAAADTEVESRKAAEAPRSVVAVSQLVEVEPREVLTLLARWLLRSACRVHHDRAKFRDSQGSSRFQFRFARTATT